MLLQMERFLPCWSLTFSPFSPDAVLKEQHFRRHLGRDSHASCIENILSVEILQWIQAPEVISIPFIISMGKKNLITITYCKEIHYCVSSLSKQWLPKPDTEKRAGIHWENFKKLRNYSNLSSEKIIQLKMHLAQENQLQKSITRKIIKIIELTTCYNCTFYNTQPKITSNWN